MTFLVITLGFLVGFVSGCVFTAVVATKTGRIK